LATWCTCSPTKQENSGHPARAHHGIAARVFITRLAQDRANNAAELRATLDELRAAFLADHVPTGAAGQVRSVAARFALIGMAGELARDYGILPWPPGEAMRSAGACFVAWLTDGLLRVAPTWRVPPAALPTLLNMASKIAAILWNDGG
jgi:hypothetical protein